MKKIILPLTTILFLMSLNVFANPVSCEVQEVNQRTIFKGELENWDILLVKDGRTTKLESTPYSDQYIKSLQMFDKGLAISVKLQNNEQNMALNISQWNHKKFAAEEYPYDSDDLILADKSVGISYYSTLRNISVFCK